MSAIERRDVARVLAAGLSAFRSTLDAAGFVEVTTPQLVPAPTENPTKTFGVDYFGERAFMRQSARPYHQALLGMFGQVYEVGPVFWADPRTDGAGTTQSTALELTKILGAGAPDPADPFEERGWARFAADPVANAIVEIAAGTPALAAVEVRRADWLFVEPPSVIEEPFPQSGGRRSLLILNDRVVAAAARFETASAPPSGGARAAIERLDEAWSFGIPAHVCIAISLERLAGAVLDLADLRLLSLFPRDAATTEP